MRSPALLLFDLGGVLIESSMFERLKRLLPDHDQNSDLKMRWLKSQPVRRFERGEISPEDFAERFIAEWKLTLTPQAFLQEFASWPRKFFPGARETLRELRKSYKVGCLSNSNPLHWSQFDDIEANFDISLFSHLIGAIKPDREIFALAVKECEVTPEEVYFFDDCAANVASAQEFGMIAYQVDGFNSLKRLLQVKRLLS
ncbi:HAD family hydrolase [Methylomonas sp. MgM2]